MYRGYSKLNSCSLRFFNIYGPGQRADSPYSAVIPKFIAAAKAGKPISVYGDGLQTRDFIHIEDVLNAYLLAVQNFSLHDVYNIGTGVPTSILEVAKIISKEMRNTPITYLPAVPSDARSSVADISNAEQKLGFKPAFTLHDGLKSILNHPNC